MAGTSGCRSRGRTLAKAASRSPRLRAREASIRIFVMRRLCRMGTSDRLSAPPADPHLRVPLEDRAGHLRDGFVGGGAGAVDGVGGNAGRHGRAQHDLAREVGGADGRDHLPHDHGVHPGRLRLCALQELADADAGEVHRREVAEDGRGLREGGAAARDDGHARAVRGGGGHAASLMPKRAALTRLRLGAYICAVRIVHAAEPFRCACRCRAGAGGVAGAG